ncbi:MAG: hypothetical protein ABJA82_01855 [Myxococcales bacterium]
MADEPIRNAYARLAMFYDTSEDDPRLYKLVQKLTDKGVDPTQWLDNKIGTRPDAPEVHATDPRQNTSSMHTERDKGLAVNEVVQGKALPPTQDERLGLDEGLAEPGIGTKIVQGAATPETRRQALRGLSDTITLGAA